MKKLTIEIEIKNDAFFDVSDPGVEIGMILQSLGCAIEADYCDDVDKEIRDSNNEVCGRITIK